jgi:hypothetical protein
MMTDRSSGGALASPATEYPSVFGKIKFFRDYPYALPTFVTGSIGAIATITSAFGIKEASLPVLCVGICWADKLIRDRHL